MDNKATPNTDGRVRLARADGRRPLPWKAIGVVAALLLIAFVAWNYKGWQQQLEVGTAYGARVGCSCRYVQSRDLNSCESDFEPGMAMISLSEDAGDKRVTASVPLVASHSAHYAGDSGCLLDSK